VYFKQLVPLTHLPSHLPFQCESFQQTGSFKYRGATNACLSILPPSPPPSLSVVTHSSGNHAQALALAALKSGVKARIVMPDNAPTAKRQAVEEVRLERGAEATTWQR